MIYTCAMGKKGEARPLEIHHTILVGGLWQGKSEAESEAEGRAECPNIKEKVDFMTDIPL